MDKNELIRKARKIYDASDTHGEIRTWIYKALLYRQTLEEIDALLKGTLTITAEVKALIKDALK